MPDNFRFSHKVGRTTFAYYSYSSNHYLDSLKLVVHQVSKRQNLGWDEWKLVLKRNHV